ncbi:interferon epsilon-like [Alligator mississippiensis]|uniref:interferon epsilon-like n=1 Tax=Alligator mississippiensis TaxID=8496 RepID=UPI002877A51C|nr:interferon epsilon-like [Alligator mississippiensis]XP_059579472.1 interferon epsilon-like [Alligator mississippiensis]
MRLLKFFLVLLLFKVSSSLHCNSLASNQNKVNKDGLDFLDKMRRNLSPQCLSERLDLKTKDIFKIELSQKDNAKAAIQELLKAIFYVLSNNLTQTTWQESSIEKFKNGLHWQIENLETCLDAEREKGERSPGKYNPLVTRLKLKRYFQAIDNFLKEKQYSQCAWEIISVELSRCFQFIDKLTIKLRYCTPFFS